jgi:hypothetical protein
MRRLAGYGCWWDESWFFRDEWLRSMESTALRWNYNTFVEINAWFGGY